MHYFEYKCGFLHCEDVPLARLAEEAGTPLYVYSHRTLVRHFRVFDEAFSGVPHLVCFAMKSLSNLAILRLFANLGGGLDIVSGGELFRGLRAGVPAERIVFAGVGKSEAEIEYALREGILMFNAESPEELETLDRLAGRQGKRARVALRVNPDVDPLTHPYIATGLKKSKFGMDIRGSVEEYRKAASLPHLQVEGVHCHIGSQITESGPFVDAVGRVVELVGRLRGEGIPIRYVNLGGGLGITYKDEAPPHPVELARVLLPLVSGLDCTFLFEPGRVIVGNAGILLTRVLYTKRTDAKRFLIVDAAMNDLIRPSLYDSYQEIVPVEEAARGRPAAVADVVGPICESGDFLARDRRLPELRQGDLLAVMSAGAYGFTMSSNYNSRPRAAEVLVKDGDYFVVRRRESFEDLVRGEEVPGFLRGEGPR